MAILNKIRVEVKIHDEIATEYDDPEIKQDLPSTVVKYIEAISDASFKFKLGAMEGYKAKTGCLIYAVAVDGVLAHAALIATDKGTLSFQMEGWIKRQPGGTYASLPFKFAALTVVETDNIAQVKRDRAMVKGMGTLKVEDAESRVLQRDLPGIFADGIAEEALKGNDLSHSTLCNDPVPLPAQECHDVTYVDAKPYATFIFHYRSKAALQMLRIIPTPDEVDELPAKRTKFNIPLQDANGNPLGVSRDKAIDLTTIDDTPEIKKEITDLDKLADNDLNIDKTANFDIAIKHEDGSMEIVADKEVEKEDATVVEKGRKKVKGLVVADGAALQDK